MNRFANRRDVVSELVLLPHNSSPKASRRLRHSLYRIVFGQNSIGYRYREPVMSAPETRRERRARERHFKLAAEALAKKVREEDSKPAPQPTPLRKMTGAVRRALSAAVSLAARSLNRP